MTKMQYCPGGGWLSVCIAGMRFSEVIGVIVLGCDL